MIPILPLIPAATGVVEAAPGALATASILDVTAGDDRAAVVAERFRADLARWTRRDLDGVRITPRGASAVHFSLVGESGANVELAPCSPESRGAHSLVVDEHGILVTSAHAEGLARGAASVIQLLGSGDEEIAFVHVEDEAAWGWRGLSFDLVRHFSPADRVRKVIDLLALYKFNVLHLHLSDNEGWRLEIPGWDGLTPAGEGEREFFTLAEYRELVAYAAERFITVVPEIDIPGHMAAALRAYPALNPADAASLHGPFPIANLSPDSPEAWGLVDDVVRTLAENTPGPFIHVGGDEAFGMQAAAHEAFVEHAITAVAAAGKRSVGWQETSRAAIGAEHTTQYWIDFVIDEGAPRDDAPAHDIPEDSMSAMAAHFAEAMHDGQRIIDKQARVIVSPISHAYLDRPHGESSVAPEQERERPNLGLHYYPATAVRDYLEWDPQSVLAGLDPERISGVEAALWCESVRGASDIDALLLPRLPAVAEVAWSGAGRGDWEDFRARIAAHAPLWDAVEWRWFEIDSIDWRRSWARS